jgi:hypothetical protein
LGSGKRGGGRGLAGCKKGTEEKNANEKVQKRGSEAETKRKGVLNIPTFYIVG